MAPRTEEERLFGAACVRLTLERAGQDPTHLELYRETLRDLRVSDGRVQEFIQRNRPQVEARLDQRRRGGAHGG